MFEGLYYIWISMYVALVNWCIYVLCSQACPKIPDWKRIYDKPEQPLFVDIGCGIFFFPSLWACSKPEIYYIPISPCNIILGMCAELYFFCK
jgi:tRNA G46 methylase TrmB